MWRTGLEKNRLCGKRVNTSIPRHTGVFLGILVWRFGLYLDEAARAKQTIASAQLWMPSYNPTAGLYCF
jgi:hypothetical protein